MYNILQWATTEPEFNEQFVFITNIVDLPKQVENPKILLLVVAVSAFCIITIKTELQKCDIFRALPSQCGIRTR